MPLDPATALGLQAEVDLAGFNAAMTRFIQLKRITLAEGVRKQAGLLASELVADTPPSKGIVDGEQLSARKAGEARLGRDIRRAAVPLEPRKWRSRGIADLIREKKYEALQQVFSHFSSERIIPFEEGQAHERARDRFGRLRKSKNQATPDYLEHAAYTKRMRGHVGIAKGGWAASAKHLGRRVPSWIARHTWAGACKDESANASDPRVTLLNFSAWADSTHAMTITGRAMARREARMWRDIQGMLDAAARKAGLA